MSEKFVNFPFVAIIGQDLMKKALLVNAIDPSIGGVLIKGDKGTGKSTAVRALSDVLPEIETVEGCPFNCHPYDTRLMCENCKNLFRSRGELSAIKRKMSVIDMPLSATEDMVVGTINIKDALKKGNITLQPGILAKANQNILYIDEVNLLDDHLVNILLDVAAMGVNIIEREGISYYHPSRFILVGTMNPEEGDLRPQILDRFGLCVEISALSSPQERLEVIKSRLEFEADPSKFQEKFRPKQEALRKQIVLAKKLLGEIRISEELMNKIVTLTASLGVRTHRADIVITKTSKALAALKGRREVTEEDIIEAALLALPHRMRQQPFEKSQQLTKEAIEEIIYQPQKEEVFDFDKNLVMKKDIFSYISYRAEHQGNAFPQTEGRRGLYIRAQKSQNPQTIAIDATIRTAIKETGELEILPEHIMEKVRAGKGKSLYIILLDSSSSMRMDRKIKLTKSLAYNLLKRSYEQRSRVALLAFRGNNASLLVPPTRDVTRIEDALENLPTGGKTPLTPALYQALQLAKKSTSERPIIILISDGKANVFIKDSLEEDLSLLQAMVNGTNLVFINTENKYRSTSLFKNFAEKLNAAHFYMEELI